MAERPSHDLVEKLKRASQILRISFRATGGWAVRYLHEVSRKLRRDDIGPVSIMIDVEIA
jgi:hypothetical protein